MPALVVLVLSLTAGGAMLVSTQQITELTVFNMAF